METSRRLLGEYLVADKKITPTQLQKALETQANSIQGGRMPLFGTVLVRLGAIDERTLTEALERQARDRGEFNRAEFPPEAAARKS